MAKKIEATNLKSMVEKNLNFLESLRIYLKRNITNIHNGLISLREKDFDCVEKQLRHIESDVIQSQIWINNLISTMNNVTIMLESLEDVSGKDDVVDVVVFYPIKYTLGISWPAQWFAVSEEKDIRPIGLVREDECIFVVFSDGSISHRGELPYPIGFGGYKDEAVVRLRQAQEECEENN